MLNQQHTDWRASGTQFSHFGGGLLGQGLETRGLLGCYRSNTLVLFTILSVKYLLSYSVLIYTTGTGARDTGATGMLPFQHIGVVHNIVCKIPVILLGQGLETRGLLGCYRSNTLVLFTILSVKYLLSYSVLIYTTGTGARDTGATGMLPFQHIGVVHNIVCKIPVILFSTNI